MCRSRRDSRQRGTAQRRFVIQILLLLSNCQSTFYCTKNFANYFLVLIVIFDINNEIKITNADTDAEVFCQMSTDTD